MAAQEGPVGVEHGPRAVRGRLRTRDVHLPFVTTTTTAAARAPHKRQPARSKRARRACARHRQGRQIPCSPTPRARAAQPLRHQEERRASNGTTTATANAEDDDGSSARATQAATGGEQAGTPGMCPSSTAQQSSGNRVVNKLSVTHGLMSPNCPSKIWRSSQFVRMHTSSELSEPWRCSDRGAAARVHRSTS